jgi:cyclopropane fatty-acyl-phospholipid synthase-like methyltransferase
MYNSSIAHWIWSDLRVPGELKQLLKANQPISCLELGCGLGRYSRYVAEQEVEATGIDFSPVAINRAQQLSGNRQNPTFKVGDVTSLDTIDGTFDVAFDVGCFHCLDKKDEQKYISEVSRLLNPNSVLLIWALNHSLSDIDLTPEYMSDAFKNHFQLMHAKFSRRRIVASRWYWLVRKKSC